MPNLALQRTRLRSPLNAISLGSAMVRTGSSTSEVEVYRTRFVHEANLVRQALGEKGIGTLVLAEDDFGERYPVADPFEENRLSWLVLVLPSHAEAALAVIRDLPVDPKWT